MYENIQVLTTESDSVSSSSANKIISSTTFAGRLTQLACIDYNFNLTIAILQ